MNNHIYQTMPSRAYPPRITPPPLLKRDHMCDGRNGCPLNMGSCYTSLVSEFDLEYIGCCTASACEARTSCIPYQAGQPDPSSICTDIDLGGCTSCTNSVLGACVTVVNEQESQYVLYCDRNPEDISSSWLNPYKIHDSSSAESDSENSSTTTGTSTTTILSKAGSLAFGSTSGQATTSMKASTNGGSTLPTTSFPASTSGTGGNVSGVDANSSPVGTGEIAGSTVAGLIGLAGLFAAATFCLRRRRKGKSIFPFDRLKGRKIRLVPRRDTHNHPRGTAGGNMLPGKKSSEKDKYDPNNIIIGNELSGEDSADKKSPLVEAPESNDGMGMLRVGVPSSCNNVSRPATSIVSNAATVSTIPQESVGREYNDPRTPELVKLGSMPTPNGGKIPFEADSTSRETTHIRSFEMAAADDNPQAFTSAVIPGEPERVAGNLARHPTSLRPGGRSGGVHVDGAAFTTPTRDSQATAVSAHVFSAYDRSAALWPRWLWRPEYMYSPRPRPYPRSQRQYYQMDRISNRRSRQTSSQQQVSPLTHFTETSTASGEWSHVQSMPTGPNIETNCAQSQLSTAYQESMGSGHELDNIDARGGAGYVTPEQANTWRWTSAVGNWVLGTGTGTERL